MMKRKDMISCERCGKCCNADMTTFAADQDIERWKKEGRDDILGSLVSLEKTWAGDRIVLSSGHTLACCSFLAWDGDLACCSIYETRPKVCRDFQAGSSRLCPQYDD